MKKIMIVEDEKSISDELFNLLRNAFYDVEILKDFKNSKGEPTISKDFDISDSSK